MKGKNCIKAVVKTINGTEHIFCSYSLWAFSKMQHCVGEDCALDEEIAEWESEKLTDDVRGNK